MPYADPIKRKEFLRQYYLNNPGKFKGYAKKRRQNHLPEIVARAEERRQRLVGFIRGLKVAAGCSDCGERHPGVLDFHHVDPKTKLFELCGFNNRGEKLILAEVAKCIVLCGNCHSKRHYKIPRRSYWRVVQVCDQPTPCGDKV